MIGFKAIERDQMGQGAREAFADGADEHLDDRATER